MMNNFDRLSRENKEKNENIAVSINEPEKKKKVDVKIKPTILSAVFANFKQEKENIYPAPGAVFPNFKGTLITFVMLIFFTAIMVAMWYFIDRVVFLPIALVFVSIAVPCLVIMFYYEFAMANKIPVAKLCLLIAIGALCYIIIYQVLTEFFLMLLDESLVRNLVVPLSSNILMFAVILLVSCFFTGNSVKDCFLVISFLMMGYVMCSCFTKGFVALFVPNTEVEGLPTNILAIIYNEEYLGKSLRNLLDNLIYDFMLMPVLYSCWGTVYAYLVYYLIESRKTRNPLPKSMYLLIVLVSCLDIMAIIDTTMTSFNIILKVVSLIVSLYLLAKMLNYSMDTTPPPPLEDY